MESIGLCILTSLILSLANSIESSYSNEILVDCLELFGCSLFQVIAIIVRSSSIPCLFSILHFRSSPETKASWLWSEVFCSCSSRIYVGEVKDIPFFDF